MEIKKEKKRKENVIGKYIAWYDKKMKDHAPQQPPLSVIDFQEVRVHRQPGKRDPVVPESSKIAATWKKLGTHTHGTINANYMYLNVNLPLQLQNLYSNNTTIITRNASIPYFVSTTWIPFLHSALLRE